MAEFFIRLRDDAGRTGIYVMEDERTGVFFHGDRCETQTPRYTRTELIKFAAGLDDFIPIEQLSKRELIAHIKEQGTDEVYPTLLPYLEML